MSMIRALRTLTALENGSLSASTLQTQLAGSASRLAELKILLDTRSLHDRICASAPTIDAIMGSALAQTAVTQVRYWPELLVAIAAHQPARNALHGSDTVLSWIGGALERVSVLRAAAAYQVAKTSAAVTSTSPVGLVTELNGSLDGTKYIALGLSNAGSAVIYGYTINTKRTGSTISNFNLYCDTAIDTNGADSPLCIPLQSSYSVQSSSGGTTGVIHVGLLRCDA